MDARRPSPIRPARISKLVFVMAVVSLLPVTPASGQQADHHLRSRPETVTWGWSPVDAPPVLTIQSGDTVLVDTLSHAGTTQDEHPEAYMRSFGIEGVLQDVIDFWESRLERPSEGRSGHVITGPIYIDDAEPGDMLEIQILDLTTPAPYGINNTGPTTGVFGTDYPGSRASDAPIDMPGERHVIRTAMVNDQEVRFSPTRSTCRLPPSWGSWPSRQRHQPSGSRV